MKFSFLAVPLVLASALFAGCASDIEPADDLGTDAEDSAAEASSELTASYANRFFGSYAIRRASNFVEFERIVLNSDGAYTANIQAPPNVRCFRAPCTVVESGRWNAYAQSGGHRVSLRPTGGALRVYVATINANTGNLVLTRKGKRSTLQLDALSRCAALSCMPNTQCALLDGEPTCAPTTPVAPPCVKTGCSGQICADGQRMSTCEFRPEYACYAQAECKRQSNGQCGFSKTPALVTCLNDNTDTDGL